MNAWSLLKSAFSETPQENYEYILYTRIGRLYDVEHLSQILKKYFRFVKILLPMRKSFASFMRPSELWDSVPEILLKADTLYVAIAPGKATLFQKKRSPFTKKDLELRRRILEWYSWDFGGFFFTKEPKFEVQDVEDTQADINKDSV